MSPAPSHGINKPLYTSINPIEETSFQIKTNLLEEIDAYARSLDRNVIQVSASISASYQAIQILRVDGERTADIRPLVRLNVSVVVEKKVPDKKVTVLSQNTFVDLLYTLFLRKHVKTTVVSTLLRANTMTPLVFQHA